MKINRTQEDTMLQIMKLGRTEEEAVEVLVESGPQGMPLHTVVPVFDAIKAGATHGTVEDVEWVIAR